MRSVEHILPEHPENNWPNVDPEMASALYKRLGNMVLLQASKNSLIGNSAFSEKKKVLKESAFALTNDVAKDSRSQADQGATGEACKVGGSYVADDLV